MGRALPPRGCQRSLDASPGRSAQPRGLRGARRGGWAGWTGFGAASPRPRDGAEQRGSPGPWTGGRVETQTGTRCPTSPPPTRPSWPGGRRRPRSGRRNAGSHSLSARPGTAGAPRRRLARAHSWARRGGPFPAALRHSPPRGPPRLTRARAGQLPGVPERGGAPEPRRGRTLGAHRGAWARAARRLCLPPRLAAPLGTPPGSFLLPSGPGEEEKRKEEGPGQKEKGEGRALPRRVLSFSSPPWGPTARPSRPFSSPRHVSPLGIPPHTGLSPGRGAPSSREPCPEGSFWVPPFSGAAGPSPPVPGPREDVGSQKGRLAPSCSSPAAGLAAAGTSWPVWAWPGRTAERTPTVRSTKGWKSPRGSGLGPWGRWLKRPDCLSGRASPACLRAGPSLSKLFFIWGLELPGWGKSPWRFPSLLGKKSELPRRVNESCGVLSSVDSNWKCKLKLQH